MTDKTDEIMTENELRILLGKPVKYLPLLVDVPYEDERGVAMHARIRFSAGSEWRARVRVLRGRAEEWRDVESLYFKSGEISGLKGVFE